MFVLSRTAAADIARSALAARGVRRSGRSGACCRCPTTEAAAHTSSSPRRPAKRGGVSCSAGTLPEPRWNVRIATFEGDVAERAEEWRVFVTKAGQILRTEHTLPEARPGATLDENAARERAVASVARDFGLDIAGGTLRGRCQRVQPNAKREPTGRSPSSMPLCHRCRKASPESPWRLPATR